MFSEEMQIESLNLVERIKVKLNLAKNTDTFFEVFGAEHHKYRLDPPIEIEELEAFEKKYNILLPEDYKVFLTQIGCGGHEYGSVVGNSGAGPDYGIFKLGHRHHFVSNPISGYLEKAPFFHSKMLKEDWDEYEIIKQDDATDEYDKAFERIYSGILVISHCGCAGYMGLVLHGEDKGRVVHVYDDIVYPPHFAEEKTFFDWYENWLNSIISGQSLHELSRFTEEQRFSRYTEAKERDWKFNPYIDYLDLRGTPHKVTKKNNYKQAIRDHWRLHALEYIRSLGSLSSEYLKILWKDYHTEINKTVRLYLMNLLVKFDYENAEIILDELYESNPIEFLKVLHLYAKEKIPDWQSRIQKLLDETADSEIKEYIQYVVNDGFSK